MKSLFTALALSLALASSALAHEGTVHYEVEPPKTDEAAVEMLQAKTGEIAVLLKKSKLNDSDLESVHEKTYSLEAAVDKLRKSAEGSKANALDAADEAVQALHFASENHEEGNVRKWFGTLKPAAEMVETAYGKKN